MRYWVIQFQQSRIDRREMVRRFCRANGVTQLPNVLPTQPTFFVPRTAAEIASELVAHVELFVGLLQSEIGYSSYGRTVIQEGQRLLAVTQQYYQVLQSNTSTREQMNIAADNVERTLQQLEAEFHRVPGVSPQSQRVLQQVSQLVAAAQSVFPSRLQQPIALRPPSADPGYEQVVALLNTARQFAYGLQAFQSQGPWYGNLSRDVQGLLTQIEAVDLMVRQGQSRSRTRSAMQDVVRQSDRIAEEMRRADLSIQQGWWNLRSQVQQTANVFGIRGSNELEPTNPVIIQRPAWSQLPYQPPVAVHSRRDRDSIRVADELVASLDDYIGSLRSLPERTGGRNQLIGSLQDLRHAALSLRQQAAAGRSANALARASDDVMEQYQRTAADYTRIVAANSTLNSPAFYRIGELCQKLRYAARGVRK
jgi:hypothetical protein